MYWDQGYTDPGARRRYFLQTCVSLGFVGDLNKEYDVIEEAYNDPSRGYHNLDHPFEMLHWFDLFYTGNLESYDAHLIRLAIIFHDFVDPSLRGGEAEKLSGYAAMDMVARVGSHLALPEFQKCSTFVWFGCFVTAFHLNPERRNEIITLSPNVVWVLDADMIRWLDPDWERHSEGIRHEYSSHEPERYIPGRRAVLEQFLTAEPLFFTLGEEYRSLARRHIAEQIEDIIPVEEWKC